MKSDITKTPGYIKMLEAKQEKRIQTRAYVQGKLNDQLQPLTCTEIKLLIEKDTGRKIHDSFLRNILHEIVDLGGATVRIETDDERSLRANFKDPQGPNAALFFTTIYGDETPPARDEIEAIPGVFLNAERSPYRRRRASAKAKAKIDSTKVVKPEPQPLSTIEALVEQLVSERTEKIRQELVEARAQLAAIRKILG